MGRLQQELLSFEHLMRQTFNERRARLMTGSYVKSLFTKFSDLVGKVYMDPVIDIAVPHSPLVFRTPLQARPGASESFHERMEFTRRLRLQAIENALLSVNAGKTPGDEVFIRDPNATGGDGTFFLSLKHAPTGLRIVIYADRWSNEPQRAEVVKKYLRKFPALEPIYIALRTLLEMHGYFNSGNSKNPILDSAQPDKRGLDPYSLMLLIVGAMKVSKPQGGYAKDDIATPFRDVISFVATWDTAAHGLSVSPGRLFIPGSEDDPLVEGLKKKRVNRLPAAGDKGSPFCIADPVDGWRDIGKAINTSGEIQELFRATIMDMDAQLETWKSFDRIRGDDGKLISRPPIMQMLGANYRSLAQWRARLVAGAYKMEDERWSNGWKEPGRRLRTAEIKKV
ncbi:hypothetical protein KEM55_008801 [Ascosphaera atra]|nr:hypothetical protein KEM55_008801 [Ascosphaera atra]